jgi:ABC-2 type transport system permease protein
MRQSGAIVEEEGAEVMQSGFAHTSPGMMVQFAIAGLIGSGTILVTERKSGALRRLLTTAISRTEIVFGHYLAMVAMIFGQLLILAAFGQLALGVNYMRAPVAVLLLMLTTALWSAALGLLIGTLAKSDDQVTIFALLPMFVLAGMGGAWVPLEFTGETFQAIGHLLPSAWAMDGFENIVIRGLGLESAWLPVGIMLAYAVGLFALAAWRFRFE